MGRTRDETGCTCELSHRLSRGESGKDAGLGRDPPEEPLTQ